MAAPAASASVVWCADCVRSTSASSARIQAAASPADRAITSRASWPTCSPPATTSASALWLWPVPILNGHRPVVSDGFGSPRGSTRHAGVDLMFLRNTPGELASVYRPGTPNGTKNYFMADDTLVLAAGSGRVWSAGSTSHGYQVILDHGRYATLYQHLERLLIPEQRAGPNGQHVDAAHPLGVVGGNPAEPPHLKHLHFELWLGKTPIDPEPMLRGWQLLEVHRLEPNDEVSVNLRGAARTTRDPALSG